MLWNPQSGYFEVPIRVIVKNQGDLTASTFKVSVSYTGPDGSTFLAPFTVPGQSSTWYPSTSTSLDGGNTVTFDGIVSLSSKLQGQTVSLQATADSCAGDEFMPKYCRVAESNEANNVSAPISVYLPKP